MSKEVKNERKLIKYLYNNSKSHWYLSCAKLGLVSPEIFAISRNLVH